MATIDQHRQDFENWYGQFIDALPGCQSPLSGIIDSGNLMMHAALPLLERYARSRNDQSMKRNSKTESLETADYLIMLEVDLFPEFKTPDCANDFFKACRNGLLHRATFKDVGWKTYFYPDGNALEVDHAAKIFNINPRKFAAKVVSKIRNDFQTYIGRPGADYRPLTVGNVQAANYTGASTSLH